VHTDFLGLIECTESEPRTQVSNDFCTCSHIWLRRRIVWVFYVVLRLPGDHLARPLPKNLIQPFHPRDMVVYVFLPTSLSLFRLRTFFLEFSFSFSGGEKLVGELTSFVLFFRRNK
jgi:hypothetical protein